MTENEELAYLLSCPTPPREARPDPLVWLPLNAPADLRGGRPSWERDVVKIIGRCIDEEARDAALERAEGRDVEMLLRSTNACFARDAVEVAAEAIRERNRDPHLAATLKKLAPLLTLPRTLAAVFGVPEHDCGAASAA